LTMAGYQVEKITDCSSYFSLLVRRPVNNQW
jgi:hypothetical protein